jgi:hypothetical protein
MIHLESVSDEKSNMKNKLKLNLVEVKEEKEEEEIEKETIIHDNFLSPRSPREPQTPKSPRIEKEKLKTIDERREMIIKKFTKSGLIINEKNKEKANALATSISDSENFFKAYFLEELKNDEDIWNIKLIISEINHTSFEKNMRSLISPLLQFSNLTSNHATFGLFHTAILV